jgi:hypothetical protein
VQKIYDLHEDAERVSRSQKATLTTREFGLVPEHGLFGSPEWWSAIADGRLPVHTVEGRISRVFMSGHNDWPEFEIDSDGDRSSWTRVTSGGPGGSAERVAKAALYEAGRPVVLKYVRQRLRQHLSGHPFSKSVLEIWIGDRPSSSHNGRSNER